MLVLGMCKIFNAPSVQQPVVTSEEPPSVQQPVVTSEEPSSVDTVISTIGEAVGTPTRMSQTGFTAAAASPTMCELPGTRKRPSPALSVNASLLLIHKYYTVYSKTSLLKGAATVNIFL